MVSPENIQAVMKILKREAPKFVTPALTKIARHKDPFKVLISCILSLRTKDEVTAEAARRLYSLAKTPEEMSNLSVRKIAKAIYPVGFYKTKAKRIKEICSRLINEFNSKVPSDFDVLLTFKGVGRKTANIVMIYAFGKRGYIAIDTHCNRIPNRLGWVNTKTPEKTEEALKKILPKRYWKDFNNLFVQFGQNICRPVGPKCSICPVNRYCKYYKEVYLTGKKVI
ncbi:MAG: endonuclease III [Candidatus Aenigmarchaeota archaeon]|nr:endonuclease III [Candidatus Aenigmarchaeota archaeon]